jgi:omega-amidase
MRLLAVQLDIAWQNKPANFAAVERLVSAACPTPDSLIVLPETFATGFTPNLSEHAEPAQGETSRFLAGLARGFHAHVLAGVALRDRTRSKARNAAVLFSPDGRRVGVYAKRHPFSLSGEDAHVAAGHAIRVFAVGPACLAPFVCYDLRFPEDFRTAVRRGATLFVVMANWPAARAAHWRTLLQARAIENQAFVVGVNRCGDDPRGPYAGGTVVFDPQGHLVAEAGKTETVLRAEPDFAALAGYRQRFPALADMRVGSRRWGEKRERWQR